MWVVCVSFLQYEDKPGHSFFFLNQSLNFHLAISYHLKCQHLLTFGYPCGYTKEKVKAIFP